MINFRRAIFQNEAKQEETQILKIEDPLFNEASDYYHPNDFIIKFIPAEGRTESYSTDGMSVKKTESQVSDENIKKRISTRNSAEIKSRLKDLVKRHNLL